MKDGYGIDINIIDEAIKRNIRTKIEEMAELLYEESMRSENWTEIVPFKDVSKEYRDDLFSLATALYKIASVVFPMPTGGGI